MDTAALALTPEQASTAVNTEIIADTAALTLTAPSPAVNRAILVDTAALTLSGQAATVESGNNTNVAVSPLPLALAEQSANVAADRNIEATPAALDLASFLSAIDQPTNISASLAGLALAEVAATTYLSDPAAFGTGTNPTDYTQAAEGALYGTATIGGFQYTVFAPIGEA